MTVVGAAVGFRTPSQAAQLTRTLPAEHPAQADAPSPTPAQAEALAAEQARMVRVNRGWPMYLAMWGVLALAGLILRFALKSELAHGLGAALVFFGGVGLLLDGFAERRARPWTDAIGAPAAAEVRPEGPSSGFAQGSAAPEERVPPGPTAPQ